MIKIILWLLMASFCAFVGLTQYPQGSWESLFMLLGAVCGFFLLAINIKKQLNEYLSTSNGD